MSAVEDGAAYLFLSLLQARVGGSLMRRMSDGSVRDVIERPPAELARELRMVEKAAVALAELRRGFDAGAVRDRLSRAGVAVLTMADEAYPVRLREIPDPPPALFVRGNLSEGPAVALVGSRKASSSGVDIARRLGLALAARGVCVVSGLALGVDAAAHGGALDAPGRTVGVLGCGIDVVYPRANRELYDRVGAAGALVSEYALGEAPLAWRFPARNRIVAGLCDCTVVVEAPEKSGALITARHALDAGCDVWAVPGPPDAPECRGSNKLLADGAGVLWDFDEFLGAVTDGRGSENGGPARDAARLAQPALPEVPAELPDHEAEVLGGVGTRAAGADVISGRSGVEMRRVLSALSLLELKGYVARDAAGNFARRTAR